MWVSRDRVPLAITQHKALCISNRRQVALFIKLLEIRRSGRAAPLCVQFHSFDPVCASQVVNHFVSRPPNQLTDSAVVTGGFPRGGSGLQEAAVANRSTMEARMEPPQDVRLGTLETSISWRLDAQAAKRIRLELGLNPISWCETPSPESESQLLSTVRRSVLRISCMRCLMLNVVARFNSTVADLRRNKHFLVSTERGGALWCSTESKTEPKEEPATPSTR